MKTIIEPPNALRTRFASYLSSLSVDRLYDLLWKREGDYEYAALGNYPKLESAIWRDIQQIKQEIEKRSNYSLN